MNILDDLGPWYRPTEAAPRLGRSPRAVRELCQSGQLDHQELVGPAGAVRYKISEQAVRRFLNRTVKRGAA